MEGLDQEIMKQFQRSPILFCKSIWGLEPQKIKEECQTEVNIYISNGQWEKIKEQHFDRFYKGKNITWQQWLILLAVERAMVYGNNKISIVSGHSCGKSSCLSWLIIWYLFCHYDAQVGATAPTSEQIHDVLWKEVALWVGKMPEQLQGLFDWQTGYIRVKERPETWFARARTARKESPEAIAGLHGDYVMIIADEAAGVPDEIYRSAEGSTTGPNVLVLLIGNGTRNIGYFYDTHNDDKEIKNWQRLTFSSEESPIVEDGYIERMESKYGRQSDEFKIRVLGGFPSSEQMDDKGWMPLIVDKHIGLGFEEMRFIGRKVLGIDPSGEGDDITVWVLRDNFHARVVATEATSNEKTIAVKTLDLIREHELNFSDVIIDNFGVGANVAKELLLLDHRANVTSMNWGEAANDEELYLNKRAECCFRGKEWLIRGGNIVGDELRRDISGFYYRNTLSGKKQIMDKPKLRKRIGHSPDRGDAFFMTFYYGTDLMDQAKQNAMNAPTTSDLYSAI